MVIGIFYFFSFVCCTVQRCDHWFNVRFHIIFCMVLKEHICTSVASGELIVLFVYSYALPSLENSTCQQYGLIVIFKIGFKVLDFTGCYVWLIYVIDTGYGAEEGSLSMICFSI